MKQIRWGIIGCGGIAEKRTIPGLLQAHNAVCSAVMDVNVERMKFVQEAFHISRGYTCIDELLCQTDIDAVYIATPVFCHKEQVKAAADAGKHILLEKPMGITVSEAEEIREYCMEKNVLLGIGFMMRFHDAHQKIKKLIQTDAIGEVVSAYAKFNCWASPETETMWRQIRKKGGGGAMMDMGIHCVDLLQYITGLHTKSVMAFCGNQIFSYVDVDDAATAIMKMDNGAFFVVEANFNIPEEFGCKFEIYGTKGCVLAENTLGQTETGEVRIKTTKQIEQVLEYTKGNMYTKEIEAFSNAILQQEEVPVTSLEGVVNQKIIEAIYKSQEMGCRVQL